MASHAGCPDYWWADDRHLRFPDLPPLDHPPKANRPTYHGSRLTLAPTHALIAPSLAHFTRHPSIPIPHMPPAIYHAGQRFRISANRGHFRKNQRDQLF